MLQLVRAEMLKITRQATTRYIALMLVGVAGLYALASALAVIGTGSLASRQSNFSNQLFPNGLVTGLALIWQFSLLVVAVVTASVIGSEYGLDTWKNLLIRRNGRARFLAAKLFTVGLVLVVIFGVVVLLTQGFVLIGHVLVSDSATKAGIKELAFNDTSFTTGVAINGTMVLLTMGVAASLATLFTVVGRSTVAGILVTVVWQVADSLAAAFLPSWMGDFTFNSNMTAIRKNLDLAGSGSIPTWQSALVMALYLLIPVIIACIVFRKRDMAGN